MLFVIKPSESANVAIITPTAPLPPSIAIVVVLFRSVRNILLVRKLSRPPATTVMITIPRRSP